MDSFTVTVSNSFEAESASDAVAQMVAWLVDNAPFAGYRVTNDENDESEFIDAEDLGREYEEDGGGQVQVI